MLRVSLGSFFVIVLFIPVLVFYHFCETFKVFEGFKQVFYFLPFMGVVMIIANNFFSSNTEPLKINANNIYVLITYLTVSALSIYFSQDHLYTETLLRDVIITSLPLLFFAFDIKFSHINMIMLLLAAGLAYLIWIKFKVAFVILNSILTSNYYFDVEYHFGTVASIFVLYFLYKKDYLFMAVAILFMLYVNKRANLVGLLPAIVMYYGVIRLFKMEQKPKLLFAVLLGYYLLFYFVGINLPYFAQQFLNLSGKGHMKLDYFLTGRMILINEIQPEIYARGITGYLFGNGPGQSEYFLWKTIKSPVYVFQTKPFLVHNDFLKLHFDIGLIGVLGYFFVMYYLYCVSGVGILLFLNVIPLFLIDNTLIFSYNIMVTCIAARVEKNDSTQLLT